MDVSSNRWTYISEEMVHKACCISSAAEKTSNHIDEADKHVAISACVGYTNLQRQLHCHITRGLIPRVQHRIVEG
jgi:hypothetical protein